MSNSNSSPESHADSNTVGSYELGQTLSEGNFCTVKQARNVDYGNEVAIKIIDKEEVDKNKDAFDMDMIERNLSIMEKIRHPNLVHLYEVIPTEERLFLVLELANAGKLFDKIETSTIGRLTESEAREYFQQLIFAMAFCHNSGISHRNLKPENLLLGDDGELKVSYFGLSALSQEVGKYGMVSPRIRCGAPHYNAPEMENPIGYEGARADIWSCGVILFYLLAGYLPFNDDNIRIIYLKTCVADFTCPSFFSPSVKRLIRRMLDPNPATRITVEKILKDEWFNSNTADELSISSQEIISPDTDHVAGEEGQDAGSAIREIKNSYDNICIRPLFKCEPIKLVINVLARRKRSFLARYIGSEIISAMEKSFDSMNFKVNNIKLEIVGGVGPEAHFVSANIKIFRVLKPPFHTVEIRKTGGDARDFDKFYRELCDSMKGIIWGGGNVIFNW